MFRGTFFAASLLVSTAATAQVASPPPEIAYAKGDSRGDAIYLVDPDGTRLTKIYQGTSSRKSPVTIDSIALRIRAEDSAGGGEVAFVEGARGLKVQRHDANGQREGEAYPITVPGEPICAIHDLDYRSDGSLVVATCTKLWTIAPGATVADSTPLLTGVSINSLTAIGTSVLYVDQDQLKLFDGSATSTLSTLNDPYLFLDATASTAYLSDSQLFQTVQLSSPYAAAGGCTTGGTVEVAPNGAQILYRYRGQILVQASNCSGSPSRLARTVRSVAWRTY